jgi:hypothetical protein
MDRPSREASDRYAGWLLDVLARCYPEAAGNWGMAGLDHEVTALPLDYDERWIAAFADVGRSLQQALQHETRPAVRVDLEVLIREAERRVEQIELERGLLVTYVHVHRLISGGGARGATPSRRADPPPAQSR